MKKILFIMTHLGSDWQKLVEFLRKDPRFDLFKTGLAYMHYDDLLALTRNIHRKNNMAAIWSDVILFNENFTCWNLNQHCRFVYWTTPFNLEHPEFATVTYPRMYYEYRLAGLKYSMKKTPGAILNPSLEDDTLLGAILG